MLKIRVTFMKKEDLRIALQKLKKEFNVLSISKIYKGRYSKFSNVYLEVENKLNKEV